MIFAVVSVLSWTAMRWAMTLVSLAALGLSLWLVFGALGYRDRPAIRLGATLGVSALGLATEPVQQTLALGQVNLLLMLLVVADLLTAGALTPEGPTRWWHGFGIGIAAGVKLTPLTFIPYLLLIRRYRQAATAAACSRHGGARLRDPAARFRHLLGARAIPEGQPDRVPRRPRQPVAARRRDPAGGSVSSGTVPWIAAAALVAVAGLIVAALLYRARQPVPAMLACALTGLRPAAPAEVECVDHWGIGGGLRASVRSWRQIPRLPARLLTRRFGVAAGRIERGHHVGAA